MAEMVLEPIIEKLIGAGLRYLKDQVTWHRRTKQELEKLKGNLPEIQAVVHFASSQDQITDQNPALNEWLWQLRDAIDDAKDVLDELEYMELEKQLTKDKKPRRVSSIMKSMKKKLVKIGKRALEIDPTLKRLEDAAQELCRLSTTGVSPFLDLVKGAKKEHLKQELQLHRARERGSLPKSSLNVRDKETMSVLEWVKNPSNELRGTDLLYRNISLLSIVGHGGMGKTTLLQHVYKEVNKDEMSKEFDHKMWVSVSKNFDAKEVIADMLELLKKERPRLEKLEALQNSLQTEMKSKKFLLVLDDVWDEEGLESKWEDVLPSLASEAFGGKILVTTRTDSVARMFARVISKEKEMVKLEGLEEDECLQLLNSRAFAGVADDDHKNLRAIAGKIVKKLLGSPLAAKVIGGVLNDNLDEGHWETVLKSNLLDQNSISSILRLSYVVLPNQLRNCFAFCCMFPQDHEYDKDDLVRMWIALGFILPSQGMTIEDIGKRYFDILVEKTLLEKVGDCYKMHDLIHESASQFFAQECSKLMDDEESSPKIFETIRHLSIQTINPDILRKIEKIKHLNSLFLFYKASNDDIYNALIEIFKASRSLRLLYVYAPDLEMIPEEIRNLIHIRYLKIDGYSLTMLPRSLSNLYHLKYIIYGSPRYDRPEELGIHNYVSSIRGIGKLYSLQELYMFDLRNEIGHRIDELKYLKDLCKLGIKYLENVKDAEEAHAAQLYSKRSLTDLTLCWRQVNPSNIALYEKVLDNLQPPACLRNLSIERYMGVRSAKWMKNVNMISNLEKIELRDCNEWESLPPFGQLPFLKSLKLSNMPKVKWLESKLNGNDKSHAFPLLEELQIWELEALEDCFEAGVDAEDVCLFPCLIKVVLINCPKLRELPSLPPELKILNIANIGWKTLNFCRNSNPIPLETLMVRQCQNITCLPLADEIARLAALRHLEIIECPKLISLGEMPTTNNCHIILDDLSISDPSMLLMEPLKSITSLKKLTITKNNLVSFPNGVEQWFLKVCSSLSELEFSYLKSSQSLPSSLESLSSLQELYIYDVPMLRGLPDLPSSLKRLTIRKCHPELKERYGKDGGFDRHKIAHIPHILIGP